VVPTVIASSLVVSMLATQLAIMLRVRRYACWVSPRYDL
jgi:hypothetical protein